MIFTSFDFLIFFSVVFPTYYLVPKKLKIPVLLISSYIFYASWDWRFCFLLALSSAVDFHCGLKMSAPGMPEKRRSLYMWLSVFTNLVILGFFKYFNFFIGSAADLLGVFGFHPDIFTLNVILPMGISFYTFQSMSYTIDIKRRKFKAINDPVLFFTYVSFFPQLVAGPIERASHLLHQFEEPKKLRFSKFTKGSYLLAKGVLFKVGFADPLGACVDAYFGGQQIIQTPFQALQATYFFAFQIYLDFFGYTLMARGIAKWLDFDLIENFNTPYFSSSITEFWRRWHISLSSWLRDYLYISLGGNRQGKGKTYRNLFLTMLLGGLWHGANWTFVAWGALHGIFLAFERIIGKTYFSFLFVKFTPRWVRQIITFHAVCVSWIFFRSSDFSQAAFVLKQCILCLTHPMQYIELSGVQDKLWATIIFVLVFEALEQKMKLETWFLRAPYFARCAVVLACIVGAALFTELNPLSFIYFQF